MTRNLFILALGLQACAALAQSKPAQTPLLSQSAPPPAPNVMMTMDDSLSMLGHSVPDGRFTINGADVRFQSGDWILIAPNDISINPGIPMGRRFLPELSKSNASNAFFLSPYAAQVMSSAVNRIYYDPKVRYLPWLKSDGTRMPDANPRAVLWDPLLISAASGTYDVTQSNVSRTYTWCSDWKTCQNNATRRWWAGIYTVLKPGANPNLVGSYELYDINGNAPGSTYALSTRPATRTDCAGSRCTQAEERQNFANWFQYYRSRLLLAKAALTEVVINSQVNAPRFGFGAINSDPVTIDGASTSVVKVPIREYSSAQKIRLIDSIQKVTASASTPLRDALIAVGGYFSRTGSTGNPWATDPGTARSPVLACRRSYNILMTDGYYNDPTPNIGEVDGVNGPAHQLDIQDLSPTPPNRYISARPFTDSNYSNTLADVAMYYYVNDLQPGLPNKVMPITGDLADPAYWQHLNQFTVSLGVSGGLSASTPTERAATISALRSGQQQWPNPGPLPGRIDDLFHAAVNTRGDYFQANNVGELTSALVSAVGRASAAGRAEAGVGVSSNAFVADSLVYVPTYRSGSWFGDVVAQELDNTTHTVKLQGGSPVVRWLASAQRPAPADRKLYTWSGTAGVAFDAAMPFKSEVGSDDLINYLRGDASKEGDGSDSAKPYRMRGEVGKLPDFINSPPVLVRNRSSGSYDLLPGDGGSYNSYLSVKQARTKGALFIGGNGGMLHAFDAETGVETFGYVPRTTFAGLTDLSKQTYGTPATPHRMFVDGPLSEHDAVVGGGWRNVLLGSLGGGGKALFALDAPKADPTALTAESVMWELSDSAMGYMMADARVGKVKGAATGAGWKAFVGNGVYSSDGSATLMVIDLATGSVDARLTADSSGGNGLMGIRLVLDDKQQVYAVYAGDLKGNLWRFDIEGPAAGDWKVGFKGKPLFRAVTGSSHTPQPITAPPVYGAHPDGGQVVVFGTGRLIDGTDSTDTQLQSAVGVRDPVLTGQSSADVDSPFLDYLSTGNGKDKLQQQLITPTTGASGYFDVTTHAIDWETQQGWYMDLGGVETGLDSGARVLVSPKRVLSYTYIDAVVPGAAPQPCETSAGKGYGFMVQMLSGARPTEPIFDTNHDGKVGEGDANAAGYVTSGDGRDGVQAATGDIIGSGSDDGGEVRQEFCQPDSTGFCTKENTCLVVVHSAGQAIKQCLPFKPVARDRVWQQLMNPPTPDQDAP